MSKNEPILDDAIEIWKTLEYRNVREGRYLISTHGRIYGRYRHNYIVGGKPENENGYIRISLATTNKSEQQKFPLHRMVLSTFCGYELPDMEVNHIDGDKTNNHLYNLEWTTRKENAEHASIHDLYQVCEDRPQAKFTNLEVHKICRYMERGLTNKEIMKLMDYDPKEYFVAINHIRKQDTWKRISKKYNIPTSVDKIKYNTYRIEDLQNIIRMIFISGIKTKDIVSNYPEYEANRLRATVKKIRQGKNYKELVKQTVGSTTIEKENFFTK